MDIEFPSQQEPSMQLPDKVCRSTNDKNLQWFGVDIGGSLCKSVYFETFLPLDKGDYSKENDAIKQLREYLINSSTYGSTGKRDSHLTINNVTIGQMKGNLHFMKFDTDRMKGAMEIASKFNHISKVVLATGGGAFKYEKDFMTNLGVELIKYDEFKSLVTGIDFICNNFEKEIYHWENPNFSETPTKVYSPPGMELYPYLVVNIGSGVSILLVKSPNDIERVGGTSMGGGSFVGLSSLLTGVKTFDEALALAEKGDHTKVDKLVRDIYGTSYEKYGLGGTVVASSFGQMHIDEKRAQAKPEDLAKACLITVTNNIGSIALLSAQYLGIKRILFAGNYLRSNILSMRTLAYAVEFWSKGKNKALFLEHEGYLGAIGTLLQHLC